MSHGYAPRWMTRAGQITHYTICSLWLFLCSSNIARFSARHDETQTWLYSIIGAVWAVLWFISITSRLTFLQRSRLWVLPLALCQGLGVLAALFCGRWEAWIAWAIAFATQLPLLWLSPRSDAQACSLDSAKERTA